MRNRIIVCVHRPCHSINLKISNRNIDSILSIQIPKVSALSYLSFSTETKMIKTEIYDIEGVRLYDNERSQDRPSSYASSPACKITETNFFLKKYINNQIPLEKCSGPTFNHENSIGYLIDNLEAHDIDNLEDFELAKLIIENGNFLSRRWNEFVENKRASSSSGSKKRL